jgi:hypothetical protein
MLVISFKLIGVFLGLYLSGVSAAPTAVSPNTPALVPRAEPADNMCNERDLWMRRECVPEAGPRLGQMCVGPSIPTINSNIGVALGVLKTPTARTLRRASKRLLNVLMSNPRAQVRQRNQTKILKLGLALTSSRRLAYKLPV